MKLIKYFTTVGFVFPRKSLTWTTKFSWLGVWDNQSVTVTEYTLSKKIKNYMAASLCLANSLCHNTETKSYKQYCHEWLSQLCKY